MSEENKIYLYENQIDLKRIIAEHNLHDVEEPAFVCDLNDVREKYEMWRKLMPRVKPYYAVKCLDKSILIKYLAELGTNFDCASKGEIEMVLACGVEAKRILFAHPYKMIPHLEYAKANGISTTIVDTKWELYKMRKYYPEANLLLRIRCDAENALTMLGDKFGCDPEFEAVPLMILAKRLGLKIVGICFHVGSGCSDLPVFDRAITIAKQLFDYGSKLGYNMNVLDIGGGYPGKDFKKFKQMSKIINASLKRNFPEDNVNIIAEPGRYFVYSAGTLICKIHAKREVHLPNGQLLSKQYYVNDGVYTSFNSVITLDMYVTVQYFVDDENSDVPKYNSIIWGPTCDSIDKIADNRRLPDLECGDFLAFPNMGAYSITIACPFNAVIPPKILYYDKIKPVQNLYECY